MACSSRCRARRAGRWQLKPISARIREICDCDSRTPKRSSNTCWIRLRVHSSVGNPQARAPLSRIRLSSRRSVLLSEGGRPRGPRERSASSPPCSRRLAQPQTVDRATPTRRATSAWDIPFRSRRPARSRRPSSCLHWVLLSMESSVSCGHTPFWTARTEKSSLFLQCSIVSCSPVPVSPLARSRQCRRNNPPQPWWLPPLCRRYPNLN